MQQLKGKLLRIFYRSGDFGTGLLKPTMYEMESDNNVKIAGNIPFNVNNEYKLYGTWQTHQRFGKQFHVKWWEHYYAMTTDGIKSYLEKVVEGCGKKTAELLVSKFGTDLEKIINEKPQQILKVLGEKKGTKVINSWAKESSKSELRKLLSNYGISLHKASIIEGAWGEQSIQRLKKNPYQLVHLRGIGFKTADEIAKKIDKERWTDSSPERAEAILFFLLEQAAEKGHVCLNRDVLLANAANDCKVSVELMGAILDKLIQKGQIKQETIEIFAGPVSYVYLKYLYNDEISVASKLALLMEKQIPLKVGQQELNDLISEAEKKLQIQATHLQREAIQKLLNYPVTILTGGPGTGKSTTVQLIVEVAKKRHWTIMIAAPTGRAAKHISNITGEQASTIHRLLKFNPEKGEWFHNGTNPLETDLLIVDEFSMVDINLAARLLDAMSIGTHLLVIGDKDQLPAVGPGRVLDDMLKSNRLPKTELNKIFRQAESSLIVTNAHRIIRGEEMRFPGRETEIKSDVYRISPNRIIGSNNKRVDDYDNVVKQVVSLCQTRLPNAKGYDPIKDIQVLVPMRKLRCGVDELNVALQKALNPHGKPFMVGSKEYRLGDRVMVMRNNYELNVFNGDMGIVQEVSIPDKQIIVDFYGRLVSYPFNKADDLALAYASTIHKSQGSEYPCVILVLLDQHFAMFQRNLLYTAVTRAKQLLVVIAHQHTLNRCIAEVSTNDRTGYLNHRIKAAIHNAVEDSAQAN